MKSKGFTLIEVVVGLVILSVISVVAVPSYNAIRKARYKVDVRNLINDIRNLKDLAIIEGKDYKIEFTKDGYSIINQDGEVQKTYSFSWGTHFTDYELNIGSQKVTYMGYKFNGNALSSGKVIISNSSETINSEISIVPVTGRVLLLDE